MKLHWVHCLPVPKTTNALTRKHVAVTFASEFAKLSVKNRRIAITWQTTSDASVDSVSVFGRYLVSTDQCLVTILSQVGVV